MRKDVAISGLLEHLCRNERSKRWIGQEPSIGLGWLVVAVVTSAHHGSNPVLWRRVSPRCISLSVVWWIIPPVLGAVPVDSEALLVSSILMLQDSNFERRRVNARVHVFLVFFLKDKNNEMAQGSNMHRTWAYNQIEAVSPFLFWRHCSISLSVPSSSDQQGQVSMSHAFPLSFFVKVVQFFFWKIISSFIYFPDYICFEGRLYFFILQLAVTHHHQ